MGRDGEDGEWGETRWLTVSQPRRTGVGCRVGEKSRSPEFPTFLMADEPASSSPPSKGFEATRGRQLSDVVGTADHYGAFVRLCKIRIEQLQITYETVDALAGFPQRYTSTLMSGGRAMSAYSMFTVARVLALTPQFAHDETAARTTASPRRLDQNPPKGPPLAKQASL
jgi:hypothetical protein